MFDLFLNPWLRAALTNWDWYNVFTNHWSTFMYLRYGLAGLIIPVLLQGIVLSLGIGVRTE